MWSDIIWLQKLLTLTALKIFDYQYIRHYPAQLKKS